MSRNTKNSRPWEDPVKRVNLPKRSRRYGIGKEIGGAVYLHRLYEHLLGTRVQEAKKHLPGGFEYTVVKYHAGRNSVSFLQSLDFDTASEPTVGSGWVVYEDGRTQLYRQPSNPFIYHHKWLFVADDYLGFDVAASRVRSEDWLPMMLPGEHMLIGRREYWVTTFLPRLVD